MGHTTALYVRTYLAALFALAASGAAAQPGSWLPITEPGGAVSLRAAYAFSPEATYTDQRGLLIGAGAIHTVGATLGARVPLGDRLAVTAALPVTYLGFDIPEGALGEDPPETTYTDLANPYVGLVIAPEAAAGAVEVEAGLWLPLASAEGFTSTASDAGFRLDRLDRETYAANTLSARLAVRGEARVGGVVRFRGEFTPVLSYYTKSNEVDVGVGDPFTFPRTNLAFMLGSHADAALGAVTVTLGAQGRYEPEGGTIEVFEEGELFADGLLAVSIGGLPVRPDVFARVPLAGLDVSDLTVGAGLSLPLR